MKAEDTIKKWFNSWESGDFEKIPVTHDFQHTSPFGTIKGKAEYLDIVAKNKDKFLGHRFTLHDLIIESNRACVRYTGVQADHSLEVSEWFYFSDGLIQMIISYYHIGEIRAERALSE